MAGENRGFIVNYYTTFNGTKLTREEFEERLLEALDGGAMTCGNLARLIKVTNQTIYNITHHMIKDGTVIKYKDRKGIYMYAKVKECLLSELLYPKSEDMDKIFKIKGVTHRRVEDGTSKGSGSQKISYGDSYYNSVHWGE
jgi:hypothetical protein